jgi:hypothetical protein
MVHTYHGEGYFSFVAPLIVVPNYTVTSFDTRHNGAKMLSSRKEEEEVSAK